MNKGPSVQNSEVDNRYQRIAAMPNAHSHAFQRALRTRTYEPKTTEVSMLQKENGGAREDFWNWRDSMFHLANTLEPDSLRAIALQTYSEMKLAGYGVVGEFHYLHHQRNGSRYDEPNIMAQVLVEAALECDLSIVLLPAAYHRNGWRGRDVQPSPGQLRFCDPDVDTFLDRVDLLRTWATDYKGVSVGVAAHSVRAVPASWLTAIAEYSTNNNIVRHIHAHEQEREIEECLAEHNCTPIELLDKTGFLGENTSIVHGIHVSNRDISLLADSQTTVICCPTTEGNLGDGYFPAIKYSDAGVPIAIGSDSQVIIDPFEEARELETGARRESKSREGLLAKYGDLWAELVKNGKKSLGLDSLPDTSREILIDLEHNQIEGTTAESLSTALATSASKEIIVTTNRELL